jgi:threonylcarbamoyladenosine tRNA methylthiotransferase MtaB
MKYAVVTFGCRVNQADSLHIEDQLVAGGAQSASPEAADLVIVNTCSVTASADQGARQTIRRVARMNPHAKIVATGCYATRCADDVAALPNVLHVVRNDDKDRLLDVVRGFSPATDGPGPCGAHLEPGVAGRTAWTLRVQTGCDERCSYCIIPTTRGRGRSAPQRRILEEVERVIKAGFKEIAITGVHLGSYGRRRAVSRELARADGLHAVDRSTGRRIAAAGPALSPSSAARQRSDAPGDAATLYRGLFCQAH